MNILITGSTGLVGSKITASLTQKKHRVFHMVRKAPVSENQVFWDPAAAKLDSAAFDGIDAVVHLAGESITGGRWTVEKKLRIRESRIKGTQLLSEILAGLPSPPRVFVSASAIGYYGDRGEELLHEESSSGTGFLPDTCVQWENAVKPAAEANIRVVTLRIGIVISAAGGALSQMLPVFRIGLGGKIGSGRQYMSWIALEDLVEIIEYSIQNESLRGPVNAVSPDPVTNRTFSKILGRTLSRPSLCMLPRFAARLVFGEMADALLLASTRVAPSRLMATNFPFRYPALENALQNILQNSRRHS